MISSRTIALFLIGVASLYVFIMICQAYRNNKKERARDYKFESTYEYETMSYDFKQYNCYENDSNTRGFEYNESICNSIEGGWVERTERKPDKNGALGKKVTQQL